MKYTIEVINGTVIEAEHKAIELGDQTNNLYCVIKYNDFSEIVENRAEYINHVRSRSNNSDVDINSKAYKKGYEDCKKEIFSKLADMRGNT